MSFNNQDTTMNNNAICVSNQRGAVLIFSLIMLLLLTLVSVSMIQQNKLELAMTGNAMDQTKSLASAEAELKLAEQFISTQRVYSTTHQCNSGTTTQLNVSTTPFFTGTGNATINAVYCVIANAATQCTSGALNDGSSFPCTCDGNLGTELYSITWVSTASTNYGSQRTVKSNYAVDCSGGPFP